VTTELERLCFYPSNGVATKGNTLLPNEPCRLMTFIVNKAGLNENMRLYWAD
jgi:hypothetical protein